MPHVIIEYAKDLANDSQLEALLNVVHQAVSDSHLFEVDNIKTRMIPVTHYRVGRDAGKFIHVQLRIHQGRNENQKRTLTHAILKAIQTQKLTVTVVTVEVVDMDRVSYAKFLVQESAE